MQFSNKNRPTYYKVLSADRRACHGGDYQYPLRRWTPDIEPAPCEQGYHLCREGDLTHWINAAIHPAKARGVVKVDDNKVVAQSVLIYTALPTWDERTARHFAADCAEAVLPIFEKLSEGDAPQQAIYAARLYAEGEIGGAAGDAAGGAAGAAAWDAAGAAAGDAALAAAGAAARDAAWAAARAAAGAAAGAAAWAAAGAAAWAAQTQRLMQVLWEPDTVEAEWAERTEQARREWKGDE